MQRYLNRLPYNTEPRRRDAAELPRRRPARTARTASRRRCLPRRARAARVSAARPQLRIDRRARSRDLRLPAPADDGARWRDRAIPGLHGRKPVFATPRALAAQLRRSLRRLHRPRHGLRGGRPRDEMGDYDWRLADDKRLEGRADAARLSASPRSRMSRRSDTGSRCCDALRDVPRRARRQEAGATTRGARDGRRCRRTELPDDRIDRRIRSSVEIEVARRLGDGFLVRLAERFLEPARQRVAARSSRRRPTAGRSPRDAPPRRPGSAAHRSVPACCRVPARDARRRVRGSGRSTSVDWQQGQVTSSSDFRRAIMRVPSAGVGSGAE